MARRWLRRLAKAMAAVVALTGLAYGAIHTPPVRHWLAREGGDFLTEVSGYTVAVEGWSGWLPFGARVDGISVIDGEGEAIRIGAIAITLKARPLFRGVVDVESIVFEDAVVRRLPQPIEEDKPFELPPLPDLPTWLRIGELTGDVTLALDGPEESNPYRVTGSMGVAAQGGARVTLTVQSDAEPEVFLSLDGSQTGSEYNFVATARDGRWLPALAKDTGLVALSARVTGPRDALNCVVTAEAKDAALAAVDGTLSWSSTLATRGEARIHVDRLAVSESLGKQTGALVTVAWNVTLDGTGRLAVETVTLESEALTLAASGSASIPDGHVDLTYHGAARPDFAWPWEGEFAPARATLSGSVSGGADDLKAVVHVEEGAVTLADLSAHLEGGDTRRIQLEGSLRGNPDWFPEAVATFSEKAAAVHVDVQQATDGVWRIALAEVEHPAVSASASGTFDLANESLDGEAEVRVTDAAAFDAISGQSLGGSGTLALRATSTSAETEARVTFSAQSLALGGTTFSEGDVETAWRSERWILDEPYAFSVTGGGRFTGVVADTTVIETPVQLTINVPLLSRAGVTVEEIALDSGGLRVRASGEDAIDGTGAGWRVSIAAEDSPLLASLVKRPLSGALDATITLSRDGDEEPFAIVAEGVTRDLAGIDPRVDVFLAGEGALSGAGALLGSQLTLASLTYTTPQVAVDASGAIAFDEKRGDLRVRAESESIAVLQPVLERSVGGSAVIDATASGTVDGATYHAAIVADSFVYDRVDTDRVTISVDAEGRPPNLKGTATLEAHRGEFSLTGDSPFEILDERFEFSAIRLDSGKNHLDANAVYRRDGKGLEIAALLDAPELSSIGEALGLDMEGRVKGQADVTLEDERLDATVALAGAKMRVPGLQATSMAADVRAAGPLESLRIDGTANLENGLVGDVRIVTAKARIEGDEASSPFGASLTGTLPDGQHVESAVEGSLALADKSMTVTTWDTTLEGRAIALDGPARASWADGGANVRGVRLTVGEGVLTVEGGVADDSMQFAARAEALPLDLLAAFGVDIEGGTLSGELALNGALDAPRGQGTFQATGIRMEGADPSAAPLEVSIESAILGDRVEATWSAGVGEAGSVEGDVRLGLAPSSGGVAMPALDGPLNGTLYVHADLEATGKALALANHDMRGGLDGQFDIGGTPRSPRLDGTATLEKGYYEYGSTSTILDNLDVRIRAEGRTLALESFSATDGADGTITATGSLVLDDEGTFPFSIESTLERARLVQRDDLGLTVAGTVGVSGTVDEIDVTGALDLGPALIRPPDRQAPPTLPAVDVVEINGTGDNSGAPRKKTSVMPKTNLNVTCAFPNRVVIRSPVLDSEWQGDLTITGTAEAPAIEGVLRVVRGYLDFLGRRFDLENSAMSFDGVSGSAPYLNIVGVAETRRIKATLRLTGPPDDLKVTLGSDPYYPEDEILARLLFDRELSELTPVQAISLARAASTLSGGLSGNMLLAGNLGVAALDRFDVRSGEDPGEVVVGAGKYLTDRVYAEVQQGTGKKSSAMKVVIELNPEFTVEGEAGTLAGTAFRIFWKRDY